VRPAYAALDTALTSHAAPLTPHSAPRSRAGTTPCGRSLRISKGWSNPNEPDHVFQKLRPEYVPGDIGFDPLGLKPEDPEEFRQMQTKELQNGRLAMLAAFGFMIQEGATGQTWGTALGRPDF